MAYVICGKEAVARVIWPNGKIIPCCEDCIDKAKGVAEALGMVLVTDPIDADAQPIDKICQQKLDRKPPEEVTEQDKEVYSKIDQE